MKGTKDCGLRIWDCGLAGARNRNVIASAAKQSARYKVTTFFTDCFAALAMTTRSLVNEIKRNRHPEFVSGSYPCESNKSATGDLEVKIANRKPQIVSLLLLLLLPLLTFAKDPEAAFNEANEVYRKKEYSKAAEEYESLLKEGYRSGALYYNLGNSYYRLQEMPKAILNYERAKLIIPGDEDLQQNLQLANLSVTDKIEPLPEIGIVTFFRKILAWHSSSGWSTISLILLWLSLAAAALYIFTHSLALRKTGFYLGIILLVLSGMMYIFARQRHQIEERKFAIIFAPVSYVKTSPEDNGRDAFYIHSGTKVEVKNSLGEWINIRLADGKTGWLKKSEAEEI